MSEFRELILLRHAKSDWDNDAVSDFQRPLNSRGRKAADKSGEWLMENIGNDLAFISSSALRAWQTSVRVARKLSLSEDEIDFYGELYLASPEQLLNVVSHFDYSVNRILLVAHNPGLDELLEYLVKKNLPDYEDGKRMTTAACAHIGLNHPWSKLTKGSGTLMKFYRPGYDAIVLE